MWVSVCTLVVLGTAGVLSATTTAIPELTTKDIRNITPEDVTNTQPTSLTTFVRPVDCADHLMAGATVSGVYEIHPFTCTCTKPVRVWCDMETDGGGWTVFLSRQHQDIQLDFNRTWGDYKAGFGSPFSEYYLGNEVLHTMTYSRLYTIRMDATLASGGYDFFTYQYFTVHSEEERYKASLTGTSLAGTSKANCLSQMHNRFFTTLDRDLDSSRNNCAVRREGAWWYTNCNYFSPTVAFNKTLILTCSGPHTPVTHLQLKLRPSTCDTSFKKVHLKDRGCACSAPQH